jgi:hypothetical protein
MLAATTGRISPNLEEVGLIRGCVGRADQSTWLPTSGSGSLNLSGRANHARSVPGTWVTMLKAPQGGRLQSELAPMNGRQVSDRG